MARLRAQLMGWQHSDLVSVAVAVAGEPDPRAKGGLGRWPRFLLVASAACGFAACLTTVSAAMREVLRSTGGFCASGGPYVIAQQCPAGSARSLTLGILGIFLFGGIWAASTGWLGGSTVATGLIMWTALFGVLGFNFLDVTGGSQSTGVLFEVMALGGFVPVLLMGADWLRRGGAPDGPVFPQDGIVRSVVRDGVLPVVGGGTPGSRQ